MEILPSQMGKIRSLSSRISPETNFEKRVHTTIYHSDFLILNTRVEIM